VLVATFSDATAWAGRRIVHEDGRFLLQDFGPIAAAQVLEYDRVTRLVWSTQGTRAWVRSVAQREGAIAPVAAETPAGSGGPGAADAQAAGAGPAGTSSAPVAAAAATAPADPVPSECRFGRSHYVGGQPSLGAAAGGALRVTPTSLLVEGHAADPELILPLANVLSLSLYARSTTAPSGVIASVSSQAPVAGPGGGASPVDAAASDAEPCGGTFLVVHLKPSGYAAFAVDGEGPDEVREALAPVLARAGVPLQEHGPGAPKSRVAGVERLAGLLAAGVLGESESRARTGPAVTAALEGEAGEAGGAGGHSSGGAPRKVPAGARELALERLEQLRLSGAITDAELSAMRAKLLE
jgi:hypothetical protein